MLRTRNIFLITLILTLLVACGSGSGGGTTQPPPTGGGPDPNSEKIDRRAIVPESFADCDAYAIYLVDVFFTSLTENQPCSFGWCPVDFVGLGVPAAPAPAGDAASGAPDGVSQTNTQEVGIDEGDLVEADAAGNLYILHQHSLVIADGFPPEQAAIIAELNLPGDSYPQEMLLDEASQRLVVFGAGYTVTPEPGKPVTTTWLIDVSNPAAPVVDATWQLDGSLLASRRNGTRVHAFTWNSLYLPNDFYASGGWDFVQQYHAAVASDDATAIAITATALRDHLATIITQDLDRYIPQVTTVDSIGDPIGCDAIAAPDLKVQPAVSLIASFDTDGENLSSAAIINNTSSVYVSETSAYLVQSSRRWWWNSIQADETAIYKYAIGSGAPDYRATGVVAGQVWNSLHLSEHDGWLRVATNETVFDAVTNNFATTNHLFVLGDDDAGNLNVAGAVENFETNEDIFAVRFLGTSGYVVTFRRIDPLFTFDLSDPVNPRLAGELELPGFSTYMQPIDDGHLLTIGREGDTAGNIGPLALRIFDVSDLALPRLAHTYLLEDSDLPWSGWSPASFDYRAFNYYAPRGLLSLPYSFYDLGWQESFNGFIYFEIDTTGGILEVGRINHNDLIDTAFCPGPDTGCDFAHYWLSANPLRSVIMTDGPQSFIHTVSSVGVKVTPADDPANVLSSFVLPLDNQETTEQTNPNQPLK